MEHLEGLEEAFTKAKVLFMTTYSGDKEHTRKMTNYNQSPYGMIWFPTERDTKKVRDIEQNNKIFIITDIVKKK